MDTVSLLTFISRVLPVSTPVLSLVPGLPKNKAQKLSEAAQNAILNPKSKNEATMTQKQDRNPDGDDSVDVGDVDQSPLMRKLQRYTERYNLFQHSIHHHFIPHLFPPRLHRLRQKRKCSQNENILI